MPEKEPRETVAAIGLSGVLFDGEFLDAEIRKKLSWYPELEKSLPDVGEGDLLSALEPRTRLMVGSELNGLAASRFRLKGAVEFLNFAKRVLSDLVVVEEGSDASREIKMKLAGYYGVDHEAAEVSKRLNYVADGWQDNEVGFSTPNGVSADQLLLVDRYEEAFDGITGDQLGVWVVNHNLVRSGDGVLEFGQVSKVRGLFGATNALRRYVEEGWIKPPGR